MGNIDGIPPVGGNFSSFSSPSSVVEQFETLYEKLHQSSPPSKAIVQEMLNFIQKNRDALLRMGQIIDYPPYPGASMQNDLTALATALSAYIGGAHNQGAVIEFAGNIRCWLGIGITPQDIYNAFESVMLAFTQSPSRFTAQNLELFLQSRGYLNTLSQFTHDPQKFFQDATAASKAIQAYEASPSAANEQAAQNAVQVLLGEI